MCIVFQLLHTQNNFKLVHGILLIIKFVWI